MAEQLPTITKSHAVNTTASPASSLLGRGLNAIQSRKLVVSEEKENLILLIGDVTLTAFDLGYVTFKENSRFVFNAIKGISEEAASHIKLSHLEASYLYAAGELNIKGITPKREVTNFDTLDELLAETKQAKEVKIEQLDVIFDSEIAALIELAGFYIEGGIRKFVDVVNAILRDSEIPIEKMKPYLIGWYEGARETLKAHGIDVSDMDNSETVAKEFAKLFSEQK